MKKFFLVPLVLAFLLFALLGGKASAAVANPNSTQIGDVAVFPDVVEAGDQLYLVRYNIDYTTNPIEPATTTFHMAIYDTDGTTLLYTRPTPNYGNFLMGIYLTPAQALTWGDSYVIRISGNPAIFDPLIEGVNRATRTLGGSDYYDTEDLGGVLVAQAEILEGLTGIDYVTSDHYITNTGASYLNLGIPGIASMVPDVFVLATSQMNMAGDLGSTSYSDYLAGNTSVSWNESAQGVTGVTGIPDNWSKYGLVAFLAGIVLFGVMLRFPMAGLGIAFLSAFLMLPFAASVGMIPFVIWAIIAFGIIVVALLLFVTRVFST